MMEDMPMVEEVYNTDAEMADYDTYDYEMQEETAGDAVPEYEMAGETAPDAGVPIATESTIMIPEIQQSTSLEVLMPQASAVPSPAPISMPTEIASPQPPQPSQIEIPALVLAPEQVVLPPSPEIPTIPPPVLIEAPAPSSEQPTVTIATAEIAPNNPIAYSTPPTEPQKILSPAVDEADRANVSAADPTIQQLEGMAEVPATDETEAAPTTSTDIVVPSITLYYNDAPLYLFQTSSESSEPLLRDYFDFYLSPLTDLFHALKSHETTQLRVPEGTVLGLEHQGLDICIDQNSRYADKYSLKDLCEALVACNQPSIELTLYQVTDFEHSLQLRRKGIVPDVAYYEDHQETEHPQPQASVEELHTDDLRTAPEATEPELNQSSEQRAASVPPKDPTSSKTLSPSTPPNGKPLDARPVSPKATIEPTLTSQEPDSKTSSHENDVEPIADEEDDFDNATIPEVTADDRAAEASIRGASSPAAPLPLGYDESESTATLESSTHENGENEYDDQPSAGAGPVSSEVFAASGGLPEDKVYDSEQYDGEVNPLNDDDSTTQEERLSKPSVEQPAELEDIPKEPNELDGEEAEEEADFEGTALNPGSSNYQTPSEVPLPLGEPSDLDAGDGGEEYEEYDDGNYPEQEPLSALTEESLDDPPTLSVPSGSVNRAITPGKRAYEGRDGDDLSEYEVDEDERSGNDAKRPRVQ